MLRSIFRPLLRGLARLLFRVEVSAQQADFKHQRLLVVANHQSFLDGLLLGLFLPIDPVLTGAQKNRQMQSPASGRAFACLQFPYSA